MYQEILLLVSAFTAISATLAAILSGICAFLSYKLTVKIRDELKSDEKLIAGRLVHPGLRTREHDNCVLMCTLFNKSKRKAFINKVEAINKGELVTIEWSGEIDHLGNTLNNSNLLGIVDSVDFFIRQGDGFNIESLQLRIYHSFSSKPLLVNFDEVRDWCDGDS